MRRITTAKQVTGLLLVAVVLLLEACRRREAGESRPRPVSSAVSVASNVASADLSRSTLPPASSPPAVGGPSAALSPPTRPACPSYQRALDEGRLATRAGKYDDAIVAFDRAVRARPVDPRARSERGYAELKRGSAELAKRDFDDARALTKDRTLLAQIYFNLASAARALGAAEDERLALAVARYFGSRPAGEKLGAASTCPAVWDATLGKPGPIAHNFLELAKERSLGGGCDLDATKLKTEAGARREVCKDCENGSDGCAGAGPWTIYTGSHPSVPSWFLIAPLPGGLFFHSPVPQQTYRVEAGHLVVNSSQRSHFPLAVAEAGAIVSGHFPAVSPGSFSDPIIAGTGRWSDAESDETLICDLTPDAGVDLPELHGSPLLPDVAPSVTGVYSLKSTRERFSLAVYAGSVLLRVDEAGAHIRGEGCDQDIPLAPDSP